MPSKNLGMLALWVRNYSLLNYRVKLTVSWIQPRMPLLDILTRYSNISDPLKDTSKVSFVEVEICLGKMVEHRYFISSPVEKRLEPAKYFKAYWIGREASQLQPTTLHDWCQVVCTPLLQFSWLPLSDRYEIASVLQSALNNGFECSARVGAW